MQTRRTPLRILLLTAAAVGVAALLAPAAHAQEPGQCRTVEVDMTPTDDLQIVMWLEDTSGNFVDTIYITQLTGTYGLGNRPGRFDFNSGPWWPYGRRTTTFPVWSNRHGMTFPLVEFQNTDEDNLSHPLSHSSIERFFCRPIKPTEPLWDAVSCASTVFTDKGVLSGSQTSLYPPRADLTYDPGRDDMSVEMMPGMNPFDNVSQATPLSGAMYTARWSINPELPNGDYVLFAEVAKEFDQNASYDFPAPVGIPWSDYGEPYRGQPSVIYTSPVTIMDGEFTSITSDFVGYGDPDGLDGDIRPPDGTITTDVPGSGAGRLLLTSDGGDMFRMRVHARAARDDIIPGSPSQLETVSLDGTSVGISFIAPGEDDDVGTVTSYDIRYLAGTPITEENWDTATQAPGQLSPLEPGTIQEFDITGLIPRTNYYIGIRAIDDCFNPGPIATMSITTPVGEGGEVDYCFIATAAYGSLLANDVVKLRELRDVALRGHVPGELAVAAYYTFGPALAKAIKPSETARAAARSALTPIVAAARAALAESTK